MKQSKWEQETNTKRENTNVKCQHDWAYNEPYMPITRECRLCGRVEHRVIIPLPPIYGPSNIEYYFGDWVLLIEDIDYRKEEVKTMSVERETPLEFMESQVFGLEMTEEQILENAKKKRGTPQRVGLELDDEQLSQVPNPQVVKKEKPLKLGSFWRDEY